MKTVLSKPKEQNTYLESTELHWTPAMTIAAGIGATGLSYLRVERETGLEHQLLNYVVEKANVVWLAAGRQTGMLPAAETFATTTMPEAVERYFVFINELMAGFDAPQLDYLRSEISPPFTISTYLVRDLRLQIQLQPDPSLKIDYVGRGQTSSLLGKTGERVLERVLAVIKHSAVSLNWPLVRVEVRYARDAELQDWEYVLLVLVFNSSFDIADKHLHDLYNALDTLTHTFNDEEQTILRRLLFFDIETSAAVFSSRPQ